MHSSRTAVYTGLEVLRIAEKRLEAVRESRNKAGVKRSWKRMPLSTEERRNKKRRSSYKERKGNALALGAEEGRG